MEIDTGLISKVAYTATIIFSLKLWFVAFVGKADNKFIKNIFIIYCFLMPLYMIFAVMYVADIAYTSWAGYAGWTTINTLFLVTDGMLLNALINSRGK